MCIRDRSTGDTSPSSIRIIWQPPSIKIRIADRNITEIFLVILYLCPLFHIYSMPETKDLLQVFFLLGIMCITNISGRILLMIRFILVCTCVIGYLILSIPLLIAEWIIGKFSPMKKDISSLRIIQTVFRFILWITGVKVTVIGDCLLYTSTLCVHDSLKDQILFYSCLRILLALCLKCFLRHLLAFQIIFQLHSTLFCIRLYLDVYKRQIQTNTGTGDVERKRT